MHHQQPRLPPLATAPLTQQAEGGHTRTHAHAQGSKHSSGGGLHAHVALPALPLGALTAAVAAPAASTGSASARAPSSSSALAAAAALPPSGSISARYHRILQQPLASSAAQTADSPGAGSLTSRRRVHALTSPAAAATHGRHTSSEHAHTPQPPSSGGANGIAGPVASGSGSGSGHAFIAGVASASSTPGDDCVASSIPLPPSRPPTPLVHSTLALIKPDAVAQGYTQRILERIRAEGFQIVRCEEAVWLSVEQVRELYADQVGLASFPLLLTLMVSGPMVALELRGEHAVSRWRSVVGSRTQEGSLRGQLATDATRDAVHASASADCAQAELDLLFRRVAPLDQTTFALLKPDVLTGAGTGAPGTGSREAEIIARLHAEGFDITRMQRAHLTPEQVRLLFGGRSYLWQQQPAPVEKPLNGAVGPNGLRSPTASSTAFASSRLGPTPLLKDQPSWDEFSAQLTSGPVLALALRRTQAVRCAKMLAGGCPGESVLDPALAKTIGGEEGARSLRAQYGTSVLRNVIHVSHSLQDASRELSLFFAHPALFPPRQETLLILKPDLLALAASGSAAAAAAGAGGQEGTTGNVEDIIERLASKEGGGFEIVRRKKIQLSPTQVEQLFPREGTVRRSAAAAAVSAASSASAGDESDGADSAAAAAAADADFVSFLSSSPVVALQLSRPDAIAALQRFCGIIAAEGSPAAEAIRSATNPYAPEDIDDFVAPSLPALRQRNPRSLRSLYATDALVNDAVHASLSSADAAREVHLVFHEWNPPLGQSTLVLVKPDLYSGAVYGASQTSAASSVTEGRASSAAESLIQRLVEQEGFEIVRRSKLHLSRAQVAELFSPLEGRIFLEEMTAFLTGGACMALEVRRDDGVRRMRSLLGPSDPDLARQQAPNSLRAMYGTGVMRNALHASKDRIAAEREVRLVFDRFVPAIQSTLCLIKPEALARGGSAKLILKRLQAEGFEIVAQERMRWTAPQGMRFYREHSGSLYFSDLVSYISSGPILALHLRREDAVAHLRRVLGPTDSGVARRTAPQSLRALYGIDKKRNGVHGSLNREAAKREIDFVFKECSVGVQETFCWIKPDVASSLGKVDQIVARLREEGFTLLRSLRRRLTRAQAEVFYAEHRSASFFIELVEFMSSSECVGLELRKENAVRALRELAGPTDPSLAKAEDPDSLRGLYGTSVVRNALHASKTLSDAKREIALVWNEFFPPSSSAAAQRTVLVITPDSTALGHGERAVLDALRKEGFELVRKKVVSLSEEQATQFLALSSASSSSSSSAGVDTATDAPSGVASLSDSERAARVALLASGASIVLELRRENAVAALLALVGSSADPELARAQDPSSSLRAFFGGTSSSEAPACLAASSAPVAKAQASFLFEELAAAAQPVLLLIKPDGLKRSGAPRADEVILSRLVERGFELLARQAIKLTPQQGKSFYAPLLPSLSPAAAKALVGSLTAPPGCIAFALRLRRGNALAELQEIVGRPSLLAQYGTDAARSGVHCPASMADNAREMQLLFGEYNFQLLA